MTAFAASLDANNALAALTRQAGPNVSHAIQNASARSGVDFSYLMQQAKAESSFDTDAQASTSSARGLFQFIESTWLGMVEKYGQKYGIDTDQPRSDLLKLRDDPKLASHMAAELARDNQNFLERHWGGDVGSTELYFAHFMGASGATSFLKARDEAPYQTAAALFPKAAAANRNVFYDRTTGEARSLEDVYQFFDKKLQIEGNTTSPPASPLRNHASSDLRYSAIPQGNMISEELTFLASERLALLQAAIGNHSLSKPSGTSWLSLNTLDWLDIFSSDEEV